MNIMSKVTVINAGYRLSVTSWENDGDNYKTCTLEGLSKEETVFLVDLSKLLYSKNRKTGCFGNMYDPSESEVNDFMFAVANVIMRHKEVAVNHLQLEPDEVIALENIVKDLEDEGSDEMVPDGVHDAVMDILSDLFGSGEFYTRVLSSFKVEYVPVEIHLEDVTEQFS